LHPFIPINNTYKRHYAPIPEDLTYIHFGADNPVFGGLGARSILGKQDYAL